MVGQRCLLAATAFQSFSRIGHDVGRTDGRTDRLSYPVCLEDSIQGEERHHSEQQAQQGGLEGGLEVQVWVGACVHPACQSRVFLKKTNQKNRIRGR